MNHEQLSNFHFANVSNLRRFRDMITREKYVTDLEESELESIL